MSEMLERILSEENIKAAYKRVYANKGAGGVDGVTVQELEEYMQENWKCIKEQIRTRTYKPQPVKRVEIPKPNGGVRKLGIPTVIDRVIEQAITQILTPIFEPLFSDFSYGFRLNRRCEQAIVKLLEYFNDGYLWVVDIDLEKFFDNVPQDKLMRRDLSRWFYDTNHIFWSASSQSGRDPQWYSCSDYRCAETVTGVFPDTRWACSPHRL